MHHGFTVYETEFRYIDVSKQSFGKRRLKTLKNEKTRFGP
ncbi:MAG: hypothetical protein QG591_970 [Planctomycetota bacterium]|nr:hypothetical protein [Planctomycetota bacterium]